MGIQEIRKSTGLTQEKFAEKFGVPLSTYKHWENGMRKPPLYVVEMIKKIVDLEEYIIKVKKDGE